MSFRPSNLQLLVLAALVAAGPVAAKDIAEGSVRMDEAAWTVADGIAYPDGETLEITFSDKAFDRAAMASDGKVDTFDMMRHNGNTLTINVDPDGPTMCLDISSRSDDMQRSGSTCNSDYPETIRIESRTAERIAGSMRWGEVSGDHVHLRFDLPIEAGAAAAAQRSGDPLPADGGEPGKAVLAHFAAVAAGDWPRLKAVSHPDRRVMMEESEKAGEHEKLFGFLQAFVPKDIRITGGTVDGDHAQVDYDATEDGAPVKGTADVVRFEGKWYFVGSTTHA